MCFYIQDSRPGPLVAKKDIICYKYGNVRSDFAGEEVFCSRYQNYYYRFGKKTERVPMAMRCPSVPWPPYITTGYHSYSNKKIACHHVTLCRQHITRNNQIRQDWGFDPSEDPLTIKVVKCIIPKGVQYYYNSETCEYVSEQIIVESIL